MRLFFQRVLFVLFVVGLAGAAWEILQLRRISGLRTDLENLAAGRELPLARRISAPHEVQLARAAYLAGRHRDDDAIELYNWLSCRGDAAFQRLLRYNLGNLHLRRAVERVEKMEIFQAVPLLELAKDAYRSALQVDPADWDTKYNLETAMRLLPEMARRDSRADEAEQESEAQRNWATLPGVPRGLP